MQAVGEAQGSLANQLTGVQQQQGAAAEPPATAALALGAQQEQDRLLLLANLAVRRQLLEQQLGHAEECREKLQRWAQPSVVCSLLERPTHDWASIGPLQPVALLLVSWHMICCGSVQGPCSCPEAAGSSAAAAAEG